GWALAPRDRGREAGMYRRTGHLFVDCEGRRDDGIDVLLAAGRVVDPVVADLRRVAGGDLVDAELGAAHRAQLAAEPMDDDVRPAARVLGGGGERVELRLRQLGRDVGRLAGRDVDASRDQRPNTGCRALDDVELAGADLEGLRDAIADPPHVVRE